MTNPHNCRNPVFAEICSGLRKINQLRVTNPIHKEHLVSFCLDMGEEGEDPGIEDKNDPIPYEFFELCVDKAVGVCGKAHPLATRASLLLIFHTVDPKTAARAYVHEAGPGHMDIVKTHFTGAVPPPQTGRFIDTNLDEDKVRTIRYKYVFALLLRESGELVAAIEVLREALQLCNEALNDDAYISRRGQEGATVDRVRIHVRIFYALADITQEEGLFLASFLPLPLTYLIQGASMELNNRVLLELDDSYVAYIELLSNMPDFIPRNLQDCLNMNGPIKPCYVYGIATTIRIKATIAARHGELQMGVDFIRMGLAYVDQRLAGLDHTAMEGAFETTLQLGLYKLLLEGFNVDIRNPGLDRVNIEMWSYAQFVIDIYSRDLQHVQDTTLYNTAVNKVVSGLEALSALQATPHERHLFNSLSANLDRFVFADCSCERDSDIILASPKFFECVARNEIRYGRLTGFVLNFFKSINLRHIHKIPSAMDDALDNTMRHLTRELSKSLAAVDAELAAFIRRESDLMIHQNLNPFSANQDGSHVASLSTKAAVEIRKNYKQRLSRLETFLDLAIVKEVIGKDSK